MSPRTSRIAINVYQGSLMAFSLIGIVAAFVLAESAWDFETKVTGFFAVTLGYVAFCALAYVGQRHAADDMSNSGDACDLESELVAFDEASEYFGGTLRSDDAFRFVASKVKRIIPFSAAALFVVDRSGRAMTAVRVQGARADLLMRLTIPVSGGSGLNAEDWPPEVADGFRSLLAAPLTADGDILLYLFSESKAAFGERERSIVAAMAERAAPLILSSMSFERSLSNALTDPITDLPNERAFHMILENQIAETQREPDKRPLTVLAIDLKGFDELNSRFGHVAGDRILNRTACEIKAQLRQMDFVARAANDEFLVILPTADQAVADEVVARISMSFDEEPLPNGGVGAIRPELYFGSATFGRQGETAEDLLRSARLSKQISKTEMPGTVVMFPREMTA